MITRVVHRTVVAVSVGIVLAACGGSDSADDASGPADTGAETTEDTAAEVGPDGTEATDAPQPQEPESEGSQPEPGDTTAPPEDDPTIESVPADSCDAVDLAVVGESLGIDAVTVETIVTTASSVDCLYYAEGADPVESATIRTNLVLTASVGGDPAASYENRIQAATDADLVVTALTTVGSEASLVERQGGSESGEANGQTTLVAYTDQANIEVEAAGGASSAPIEAIAQSVIAQV